MKAYTQRTRTREESEIRDASAMSLANDVKRNRSVWIAGVLWLCILTKLKQQTVRDDKRKKKKRTNHHHGALLVLLVTAFIVCTIVFSTHFLDDLYTGYFDPVAIEYFVISLEFTKR